MRKEWFTTAELVSLTELPSRHMVAYLCRTGVLTPSLNEQRGRGVERKFSLADLILARAVAKLLRAGVSVAVLKNVLATLRSKLDVVSPAALSNKHVVIVGQQVYLLSSASDVTELSANGQLAFHFVLETESPRIASETKLKRRAK